MLNLTLFIRIRTQLVVISAMVTPEANPETSAAGPSGRAAGPGTVVGSASPG